MKSLTKLIIILFCILTCSISNAQIQMPTYNFDTPYGHNESVGKYANINGIRMYYEEYGEGEPLFIIHSNAGAIKSMAWQIEYFKSKYRVIIADSRGHGKSESSTGPLTYIQIAKDWAELANQLNIDSVHVIGFSDGGIIGLLMGINHPDKVNKT